MKIDQIRFVIEYWHEYGDNDQIRFNQLNFKGSKVYYDGEKLGINKEQLEQIKEGRTFTVNENGGNSFYSPIKIEEESDFCPTCNRKY